jgi:hypothetical protein
MAEDRELLKLDESNSAQEQDAPESEEDEETPPTPFDHPLFLPVLLFCGMLWFGYDGWLETDPGMLEHQQFNRYGFAVLTVLTAWFGYKGWGEYKEEQAAKAQSSPDDQ